MSGREKVIIVGSAHPLRAGGISTFNERLARAFQREGHPTTIYNFSLQYPGFLFPGKTQYSDEPPPNDLEIVTVINSVNPLNWIKVGRKLNKLDADIIVVRYWIPFMAPCLGTINRLARKNGKSKVVAITDNVVPHERRPGDTLLTKYFVNSADAFIAMSDSVMQDLEEFDTEKPREVILHPLYDNFGEPVPKDKAREMLGLDPEKKYLLFFGLIRDYKGLDLLLEALADEELTRDNLNLVVAGEFYADESKYRDMVKKYDLEDRVQMKNEFISNEDVHKYFCACDLVVQPYKSATQSGVTQVAYHFNKPMVVTDVGALPQMVPHGKVGYVVKPDPREIANAITDFYQNNKEELFVSHVVEEKKRYTWDKLTSAIRELAERARR